MESDITGLPDLPELRISQGFELADFFIFWQNKRIK